MKTARVISIHNLIMLLAALAQPVTAQLASTYLSADQITGTALNGNDREAVVLIHGWTGEDPQAAPADAFAGGDWSQLVNAVHTRLDGGRWKLLLFHWENDASTGDVDFNIFGLTGFANARTAAGNAFVDGATLAESLNQLDPNLREVVFVAHSAGSWAAYRAIDQLLRKNPYVIVNLVLLDPFVPGVDPSVPTVLNTATMSLLASHPSADRIYRMENYYAIDYTDVDFDWGNGGGSRATSQVFSWRSRDINQRVDYPKNPILYPLNPGNFYGVDLLDPIGHGGPIRFYADTVTATSGVTVPNGLAQAPWSFTSVGFYRGLVTEGFLLPSITAQPLSVTVPSGGTAILSVSASRGTSYQWFKNDQEYPATGPTIAFNPASSSDAGVYVVRVSNANGLVFSDKATLTVTATPTVDAPSITPFGGSSPGPVEVTLGCDTVGAQIYYTLNGNDPTTGDTAYTSPFTLTSSATVKARGFFPVWNPSLVISANFSIASVQPTVTVAATSPNAAEQNNTPGRFTITRSGSAATALAVNYSVSGTAQNGVDYLLLNGTATLGAGVSSVDVVVTPLDDSLPESTETVVLTLASDSGYIVGTPSSATVTIADNDSPPSGDTEAPRVAFITPNGSPFYTTANSILINGKAYDNVGVVRVTWANSLTGGTGTADTMPDQPGTLNWSVTALPLSQGANIITVTAYDAAEHSGSQSVTVQASPNSGSVPTPTGVAATKGTLDTIVRVNWPAVNVAGYEIWRSTANDIGTATKVGDVTQTFFDDYNAAPPTTYYYWVRAYDASRNFSNFSTPDTGWRRYVPPTFASLVINGPSYAVKNGTAQYSATAVFSDGTTQPASPIWSVAGSLATISSSGLLSVGSIASDGTVTISATSTVSGVTLGASLVVTVRLNAGNTLEVPSQFPTIQAAMDAAQAGDTVHVAPGNYCGGCTVKSGVTLLGSGMDRSRFDCFSTFSTSANSEISGFGGYLYVIAENGPTVISNNRFEASLAIDPGQSATVLIRNNIFLGGGIRVAAFYNPTITIENNTIANPGMGIYVQNAQAAARVYLRNNIISFCNIGVVEGNAIDTFSQHIYPSYNCYYGNVKGNFGESDSWWSHANYFHTLGSGDTTQNPTFVNQTSGDYHLDASSPCINAGDPGPAFNDLDGTRNDKGVYGGPGLRVFTSASQTIAFDSVADKTYGDPPFSLSASASSGLPVTFTVVSGPASLSSGRLSITGAGVVLVRASQTGNASFNPAPDVIRSFAVNKAVLTVTANSTSRLYGAANPGFGAKITGFVNGETASVLSGTPTIGTATAPNSPPGAYPITPSLGSLSADNYSFSFSSGTLTITKATLTVAANSVSRAYGSANPTFNAIISGFVAGDTLGAVTGSPNVNTPATASSPSGDYAITPTLGTLSANNYDFIFAAGVLTVDKAPLTVTVNNATKTYGTLNPSFTATLSGFVNGDQPSVVTGSPGYSTTAGPASPIGVYLVAPVLNDLTALNYSFVGANGTLAVEPAPLTVTASNAGRTYGAANPSFTGAMTGLQNGDNITASYICSATSSSPVGQYPIVPTLSDPGSKLGNYSVTLNNGALSVSPASLTVTVDNKNRAYGAPNPQFTGAVSGVQNGDNITASFNCGATPSSPAGTYPIVPLLNDPNDSLGNYNVTLNNGTLTVAQAPTSVSLDSATLAQTYTGSPKVVTAETIPSGLAVVVTYSGNLTPPTATGSYSVTVTVNDPNYSGSASGTLMVGPAPLTITANNLSKGYGQTVTFAGTEFTANGLVGSDTVTGATLTSAGAGATATVAGSPYSIAASAATGTGLANYTINYQPGTLTVAHAGLTITASGRIKTYGQAVTFAGTEFTPAGLLNGDTVSSVALTSAGGSAAASVAGSPYSIVPSGATGTGLGNYVISYQNGTLTVSPAAVAVSGFTANNKVYDGMTSATFSGTPVPAGVIGSDVVSISGTPRGTFTDKAVANNKSVTVTGLSLGGADAANYTLSMPALSANITPAALAVTADDKTRTFGTGNPPFTGTSTGLQAGDAITANYNCSATIASPAGTYPIVPSLVDPNGNLPNYSVTLNNGTLTVTPLGLKLGEPSFTGQRFGLSIATEPGLRYTLEYTLSLTAPVWTPVQTVVGDGAARPLADANASDAARFYRVRVEPQGP